MFILKKNYVEVLLFKITLLIFLNIFHTTIDIPGSPLTPFGPGGPGGPVYPLGPIPPGNPSSKINKTINIKKKKNLFIT